MILDSHSHYDDPAFDEDRDVLLSSLKSKNVGDVICCSASWDAIDKIHDLCTKYSFCHMTVGIHPEDAKDLTDERIPLFEEKISSYNPVAIGEIGLDYHYDDIPKDLQRKVFIYQLELAERFNLPVIIHSREAAEETMDIIKEHCPQRRGVIHCFSSSYEMACEYIKMGFYIGIGGVVTFKNGVKLKEVAKNIPLSSILIETDCPYMAPVPFRGQRNDSSYLSYVVDEIASLRNISSEEVIKATEENARRLFNI